MASTIVTSPSSPPEQTSYPRHHDSRPSTTLCSSEPSNTVLIQYQCSSNSAPRSRPSSSIYPGSGVMLNPVDPLTLGPAALSPRNARSLTTIIANPFDNQKPLPLYRKTPMIYVYPDAPIGQEHIDRAPAVIDIFRENVFNARVRVSKEKLLRDHRHLIDYEIKMCGPNHTESKPSILVICTREILPALKHVLTRKHVQCQYSQSTQSLLRSYFTRDNIRPTVPRPEFGLYFWPDLNSPRNTLSQVANSYTGSEGFGWSKSATAAPFRTTTMCGSTVYLNSANLSNHTAVSTIACSVEIDSSIYGITTAHAFTVDLDDTSFDSFLGSKPKNLHNNESSFFEFSDDADSDIVIDSDDDYDISSDNMRSLRQSSIASSPKTIINNLTKVVETETPRTETGARINRSTIVSTIRLPYRSDSVYEEADLDWAVIEMKSPLKWLLNAYYRDSHPSQMSFVTGIALKHPQKATKVFIVSSSDTAKPGILLTGSSYLGGLSRGRPCKVWNVTLLYPGGDSGSLVVDASTNKAYGYVAASNPLGEIYVVPLYATLKQLSRVFKTTDIRFPNPLCSLVNQTMTHLKMGEYLEAGVLALTLSDLVSSMRDIYEWPLISACAVSASKSAFLILQYNNLIKTYPAIKVCMQDIHQSLAMKQLSFNGVYMEMLLKTYTRPSGLSMTNYRPIKFNYKWKLLRKIVYQFSDRLGTSAPRATRPKSPSALIKALLSHCVRHHKNCIERPDHSRMPTTLPRRLIAVGRDTDPPNLHLIDSSVLTDYNVRYVALSYVWDFKDSLRLLKHNEAKLKTKIPWNELSRISRDAIIITKNLGINYVWIDALCILQDSSEEKDEEILNLGEIFGGAHLTICAADSPITPLCSSFRVHGTLAAFTRADTSLKVTPYRDDLMGSGAYKVSQFLGSQSLLERKPEHNLWFSRAWTFQESFFSHRKLIFSGNEIVWQCSKAPRTTVPITIPPGLLDYYTSEEHRMWTSRHMHVAYGSYALDVFNRAWSNLISEYTRNVHVPVSKRSKAIARVADTFQAFMGMKQNNFIHGLWRPRLAQQLMWKPAGTSRKNYYYHRGGPSWSWLYADAQIELGSDDHKLSTIQVLADTTDLVPNSLRVSGPFCYGDYTYDTLKHPITKRPREYIHFDNYAFSLQVNQDSHNELWVDNKSQLSSATTLPARIYLLLLKATPSSFKRCDAHYGGDYDFLVLVEDRNHDYEFRPAQFRRVGLLRIGVNRSSSAFEDQSDCVELDKYLRSDNTPASLYQEMDSDFNYTITLV